MNEDFKNFYLTDIGGLFQVYSPLGVHREIENRKYSGLLICTSGAIEYKHNGKVFKCDKNHILFVSEKMTYCLDCVKEDISYVINFKCTKTFPTFKSFECNVNSIVEYIDRLRINRYKADSSYFVVISRLILDIILKLTTDEEKKYPLILLNAIDYIHDHFTDSDITNEAIAKHCSISVIYLQKLFAKYIKKGTKQYIDYLRFHKAEDLLLTTDRPVYQIANECGFTNQITFFRAFEKKHNGLTPTEFRKLNSII